MHKHSKSILALSLLLLALIVGLSGCDWFASLFDPLVGTWDFDESSISGMSGTLDMNWNKTFSLSLTMSSVENTASGTYSADEATKMFVMDVKESTWETGGPGIGLFSFSYALSTDEKILTLTGITTGITGLVITFIKR